MLTQAELKSVLHYNPDTGIFTRITKNSVAGSLDAYGYWVIRIGKKIYKAHRLAWLYQYGSMPKTTLDHIDMIKTNNIITNLREATIGENKRNCVKHKMGTHNYKGIRFDKRSKLKKPWQAQICINYKNIYLGSFKTAEEAARAYDKKALELFGEFANLNFKI